MATYAAASASYADVSAAIALCAPSGDTVTIPADTSTWTSQLLTTKAITIQGAGVGQTYINCGIVVSGGTVSAPLRLNTSIGSYGYRITGIQFGLDGGNVGAIVLEGYNTNIRVDNCRFDPISGDPAIRCDGGVRGVIDNCVFVVGDFSRRAVNFFNGSSAAYPYGDAAWLAEANWGTADFMFVEDCTMERTGTVNYGAHDGWFGGKACLRYNTYINCTIGNHGTESSQRNRGMRAMEIYRNTMTNSLSMSGYISSRGGASLLHNNTLSGTVPTATFHLNNYRAFFGFKPWGCADGTKNWDINDTGGSAGVFDSGTATGGGTSTLTDSSKSWIPNQWAGYTLRHTVSMTATGGASRSVTVSGAGWVTNQWKDWEVTQVSTNYKASIHENTTDTITLSTESPAITFAASDAFIISRASEIVSNTATQLTVMTQGTFVANYAFTAGDIYEIRRVTRAMDQCGAGKADPLDSPNHHKDINQESEPCYQWDNTLNGSPVASFSTAYGTIQAGRDYFNSAPSGYTEYTYPHPLRGSLAAPTILTHPGNQTVPEGDTVVMSAVASGNPSPTYQWRKGGVNISGATSATLTLVNVQTSDAGSYDCVATNSEGSATSNAATLTVNPVSGDSTPNPLGNRGTCVPAFAL